MSELPRRLLPTATKPVTSVARVPDAWYVVALARELRGKPLRRTLLGLPLVLFRDPAGQVGALLDRCPHRNVPLSLGRVVGPHLQCGYHGWEFDIRGACQKVPTLCGTQGGRGRNTPAFPAREQDGFVWVYGVPDVEPQGEPFRFPHLDDRRYTHVTQVVEAEASLHAVAENALDVPHTAFLHRGLFRGTGAAPNQIRVALRRWHDRVEAEYIGEPRPPGLAGRILAPGGGTVEHFDRFILPCIAQVEYRMGDTSHFCVSTALTPIEDFRTRLYAQISFRIPLPGWLVALVLRPVAKKIFAQDAVVLAAQTATIQAFGGEQYTSTDVDILGPHILRLLRSAERGELEPASEPVVKELALEV